YRLALNARRMAMRRRQHETIVLDRSAGDPLREISAREFVTIIDEELMHLGEKMRAPLVLCCLEGATQDQAARCLGISLASLKRRLEQGKRLLEARLAGRGVALSVLLTSTLLTGGLVRATLPATLVASISQTVWQATKGATRSSVAGNATLLANEML